MAAVDYIELEGNGFLLEAAKRLSLTKVWKEKPSRLNDAQVEYCSKLVRYLVQAFVVAEGLESSEKFRILKELDPTLIDMRDAVLEGKAQRGTLPTPVQEPPALQVFLDQLNQWHCELATVQVGVDRVLSDFDGDPAMSAIGHVLNRRFLDLVESCPFPTLP